MPFSFRRLTKLNALALCFIAIPAIAVLGFGMNNWFKIGSPVRATYLGIKPAAAADQTARRVVQELLTLRRSGFDPAELTIPSGNFLLAIDNLSGVPDVQLTLAEEKKNKLKDIKFASRNRDGREEIDLKTGVYILSAPLHPAWTCRITVTDQTRPE